MTPFGLLGLSMAFVAAAWLAHPRWSARGRTVVPASGTGTATRPHDTLWSSAAAALLVLALIGGAWAWFGAPGPRGEGALTAGAPAPPVATSAAPPTDAARAPDASLPAMTERLAERMKTAVDDADGWHLLGRNYASLGRHAQAVDAFRQAARIRPDDAALLTEWAFSAAVIVERGGGDDPVPIVERALRLSPRDAKALALAGTLALERRDYAAAVDYWERLARVEPPGSPMGLQIRTGIAQVRQRAAAQSVPQALASPSTAASNGGTGISGIVTLAPSLRGKVGPEDTVIVYARAPAGPRMPLAMLRRQVKDLPLRFTLDETHVLNPAAALSGTPRVIVGARVAKSGQASARDGDLQGQLAAAVPLGSRDLRIEIADVVRTR